MNNNAYSIITDSIFKEWDVNISFTTGHYSDISTQIYTYLYSVDVQQWNVLFFLHCILWQIQLLCKICSCPVKILQPWETKYPFKINSWKSSRVNWKPYSHKAESRTVFLTSLKANFLELSYFGPLFHNINICQFYQCLHLDEKDKTIDAVREWVRHRVIPCVTWLSPLWGQNATTEV